MRFVFGFLVGIFAGYSLTAAFARHSAAQETLDLPERPIPPSPTSS